MFISIKNILIIITHKIIILRKQIFYQKQMLKTRFFKF